jgi:hypothetical protein
MPIDAAAYPHILDAVISSADRSSLLALRAGSTAFRDRVDAVLFEHIGVHYQDGAAHMRSVDGARLPSLPIQNPASGSRETAAALARFAQQATHVHAVDLYAPVPAVLSLLHPKVVRRRGPRAHLIGCQLRAHTYVDSMWGGASGIAGSDALDIEDLPPGLERSVITLGWELGRRVAIPAPRAREVVLVLDPSVAPGRGLYLLPLPAHALSKLANGPERVTVVGWAPLLLPRVQLPVPSRDGKALDVPPDMMDTQVQSAGEWWLLGDWLEDYMERARRKWSLCGEVRFLSHAEWAAEAGKYIVA